MKCFMAGVCVTRTLGGHTAEVSFSLRAQHLGRYREIATLLVKHGRADAIQMPDPDGGPVGDGTATADDADKLVVDLEAMGPTFVKLGQLLSTRADLLPPI